MHDLDLIRQTKIVLAGEFAALNETEPNSDRAFKLGSYTFTFRAKVGANLIARFYDTPNGESSTPQQDGLAAADALILSFLEPGQEDAWTAVRADDAEDPLTLREVVAVGHYLLGAMTARPTEQQSGSSATPGTAGTNSTEPLRSLAEV